ncbi:hypothetical protein ACHQM5_003658 [Ranunculus cassubicifolius]
MIMSLYHGKLVRMVQSHLHWNYAIEANERSSASEKVSFVGPLFVIASSVAWSGWFIVQSKMNEIFIAPYTTTGLMCFMAIFENAIIGLFFEHDVKEWSLSSPVRLIGVIYNGLVVSAVAYILMSWVIKKRGPVYVSAFSPLLLVIVAVFGWALLDEKIYVGSAVGSILIVAGLYIVLWGKEKDMEEEEKADDVEMPPVLQYGFPG